MISLDLEYEVGSLFLQHLRNVFLIEMLVKAETSPERNTPVMNYPPFLENGSGQDTSSYFFIPPSFGEFEMIHITSRTV